MEPAERHAAARADPRVRNGSHLRHADAGRHAELRHCGHRLRGPHLLPATADFSIAISSLGIITASLSDGTVGIAYGQALQASGGTPPYTWSILGSLPAGLTLSPGTGTITGIPTTAGPASFTVQVKDSGSPSTTASANLSINIAGAPAGSALPVNMSALYIFNNSPSPDDGGPTQIRRHAGQ